MSKSSQPNKQSRYQASTNPALAIAIRRKNKNPKKVKKRAKKQLKGMSSIMPAYNHISECALMYASALMDPEGTSEGACVPYGFPTPSMKQKVFTRGTFQLGTTGQGFILYKPNICRDGACITTTNSTSIGTSATALTSFTSLTNTTLTKLMFGLVEVFTNKTVAGRVVAGGIKIRYAGTESGRNGTMCALEEPNHGDLGIITGSAIRGFINSFVERPDPLGSFFGVNFSGPITALETQFQNISNPIGANPIVIFVDGLPGDKYEFEVYQHVEYVGQEVPGVSASHADPELYAKIVENTKAITLSEPLSDKNNKGAFNRFLHSAGATIKSIFSSHGPDILGMVSNALLPGSGMVTRSLTKALTNG